MAGELPRELGRILRAAQTDRLPSIAAALARGGEILWQEALGLADGESSERATTDHQYRIGSITKTFTAVAIMQLRDAGALALDDPVSAHISETARIDLTIRRLLSHLSGIQSEPPGAVWETLEFPTGAELIAGLSEAEQVLAPGRRWHYSNLAFALLGEIVERCAGTAYERYVQERILDPLGLGRTGFDATVPFATPYAVDPFAEVLHSEPVLAETGSAGAAGSLWSTVADLCRWGSFLADPDPAILDPETNRALNHGESRMAPQPQRP